MLTDNEKKVLRYIMAYSYTLPSINRIARDCNLAPNGAYKILKKFEKEGILKYRQISKIKSYFLDYENEKTQSILALALIHDELEKRIQARREDLKPLREITDACILFGSYAENKKEPSDLDILFIIKKDSYREYKKILEKIKDIVPVKVHDMLQTEEDLINNIKKKDKIVLGILEKGIILWGQEIIIRVVENANE